MLEILQNRVTEIGKGIANYKRWRMRTLLLISTIFSILILSWALPRWTAPKNCISSTFVEQISLPDSKQKIEGCDLRVRTLSKTPPDWMLKSALIARIDAFETYAFALPKALQTVRIRISESNPEELVLASGELRIGVKQIERPTVLERALMTYWFAHPDPMAAQIIGDFAWNFVRGRLKDITKPEPWLYAYAGMSGYCSSRSPLLSHTEYCSIHNELGDSLVGAIEDDEGLVWSLYPVFTKILAQLFLNAENDVKMRFLERLYFTNTIDDLNDHLPVAHYPSLTELDTGFTQSVIAAFLPLGFSEKELLKVIEPYLMRNAKKLSYMVVSDEVPSSETAQLPQVIVESEQATKTFYPGMLEAHISRHEIFKYLDVREVVFVGCTPPQVSRLLEFEPFVRKVTFVRACEAGQTDLKKIIKVGVEEFIKNNPAVEFIEFNLKALRVTKRLKGAPLKGFDQFSDLTKWLESNAIQYDAKKQAYRPQAAYEVVNWYRWNN